MNPYDELGAEATVGVQGLRALMMEAIDGSGPRQRALWAERLEALERDPQIRWVWLMTSRSRGRVHPWDEALGRLKGRAVARPLKESVAKEAAKKSVDALSEQASRQGALRDLVELPQGPADPVFERGLIGWESSED